MRKLIQMCLKIFMIGVLFVFNLNIAFGQSRIGGTVTSDDGETLPGVNVLVKGTSTGSITDANGKYEINVPADATTLVFSYVGFLTEEVQINGRSTIDLVMSADISTLSEVVVVGYGQQKKSDLTAAISSVKGEELQKFGTSHPADALQGKTAGVTITKRGGSPGANLNVNIRGVGTTSSSTGPLYIIDGLPGSFYLLNPDDIESIEVLKDAAAAAIYGVQAANGVVLITTKKGKKGDVQLDFSSYYGVTEATELLDLANSSQFRQIARMAKENQNLDNGDPADLNLPNFITNPNNVDTDWQDAVFDKGSMQNYNVTMRGGGENINFMVSGSYFNEDGIALDSDFEKYQIRGKSSLTKGRFQLQTNLAYTEVDRTDVTYSMREVFELPPVVPVFDSSTPDGYGFPVPSETGLGENTNPVGRADLVTDTYEEQYLEAGFTGVLELFEGLNFTSRVGIRNSERIDFYHEPANVLNALRPVQFPAVSETRTNWRQINFENFFNYQKSFDQHSIDALAGIATRSIEQSWAGVRVDGFTTDADGNTLPAGFLDPRFNTISAGDGGTFSGSGSNTTQKWLSYFGRINYSFDGKYLLQVSVRRDGSSKFGADSRWGTFPSVAAGWNISNESFFSSNLVNYLKLRASWGQLGNDGFLGPFDFQNRIVTGWLYPWGSGETHQVGAIATELENRSLQWETADVKNVGIDFGVLDDRISGSINYYIRDTRDMLVSRQVPSSAGINNPTVNIGEVRNQGLEIELGYRKSTGEFQYGVNVAFATNKNEVTSLSTEEQAIFGEGAIFNDSHFTNQSRVGSPIGGFYLYQTNGLFQSVEEVNAHTGTDADGNTVLLQPSARPGDIRFVDTNNDGVIDGDDRVFSGTPIPKVDYGVSFNASYKGFDLTIQLHGRGGNKIYNTNRMFRERMDNFRNYSSNMINAWTPSNTNTDVPRAIFGDPNQNSRESTRFLESGNFLRLKNVQLGYTFPGSIIDKLGITKLRVYVSAQNLLTITDYSGFDPEVGRSNPLSGGLDRSIYPITKSSLFGLQVSF
ncbi:TonB-dependent receptor [Fulvivirgaceae bacterium BMA10]|uniref:TonB-dependent receptor n=1 Tax=Splendidivirga corallicola TaxID=3051826 RepID=A0ABT8KIQ5_9BACT|nr:TonB-dependent receptor [Fulvivirgaceae bacterium BMA10]